MSETVPGSWRFLDLHAHRLRAAFAAWTPPVLLRRELYVGLLAGLSAIPVLRPLEDAAVVWLQEGRTDVGPPGISLTLALAAAAGWTGSLGDLSRVRSAARTGAVMGMVVGSIALLIPFNLLAGGATLLHAAGPGPFEGTRDTTIWHGVVAGAQLMAFLLPVATLAATAALASLIPGPKPPAAYHAPVDPWGVAGLAVVAAPFSVFGLQCGLVLIDTALPAVQNALLYRTPAVAAAAACVSLLSLPNLTIPIALLYGAGASLRAAFGLAWARRDVIAGLAGAALTVVLVRGALPMRVAYIATSQAAGVNFCWALLGVAVGIATPQTWLARRPSVLAPLDALSLAMVVVLPMALPPIAFGLSSSLGVIGAIVTFSGGDRLDLESDMSVLIWTLQSRTITLWPEAMDFIKLHDLVTLQVVAVAMAVADAVRRRWSSDTPAIQPSTTDRG